MAVKKKKIVFVIVEGPSDSTCLENIMDRLYSDKSVYFEVVHGDITSRNGVNAANIVSKIHDMVKKYMNNYHVSKKDFKEIIHLVDMDGAFIGDDMILNDENCSEIFYSTSCIRTNRVEDVINRNARKRANISRISTLSEIGGIRYQCYYVLQSGPRFIRQTEFN